MRRFVSTLALLSSLAGCHAATVPVCPEPPQAAVAQAHGERQPLVRLQEYGSWGSTMQAAGVPEFTLYADGLVLFARGVGEDAEPMQARLSSEDTYALADRVSAALRDLPESNRLVEHTDAGQAAITVFDQDRVRTVGMYGFSEETRAGAPGAFAELRDELAAWDHPDAEPWTPDELMISMIRVDDAATDAWPELLPQPPQGAREPRERVIGRSGTTIRQPIRYRVSGGLEQALAEVSPSKEPSEDDPQSLGLVTWNGATWHLRYQRVVPAQTWF
jgi:hypothetical protein